MTRILEDEDAWAKLRGILDGSVNGSLLNFRSPPLERLRTAIIEGGASPLDLAVLMRHSLVYQTQVRGGPPPAVLRVPVGTGWPGPSEFSRTGIRVFQQSGFLEISAADWHSRWLRSHGQLDRTAASEAERRSFVQDRVQGDPFLMSAGMESYRSAGQAHAVRSALTLPPGATLLVRLSTGEGKSLVFKLIDSVGFGASEPGGTTVVVVPTVTLAIDHEKSCSGEAVETPRAYLGGPQNAHRNQVILDRIENGTQGLCFASPEAVCGPMRQRLVKAAQKGRLRALIIDEAHLVESWGTEFRPHFQVLSGVRYELLQVCPEGASLRTVLLSATVTQNTLFTLEVLFGRPGPFGISSSLSLRPEIEFWVGEKTSDVEREERVIEAVLHAPRPALIYTSRVEDAINLHGRLSDEGFRRLALIHGSTDGHHKEATLDLWKSGMLDLVVATSAFGLGIDYPHTRTVIHACIPETLDRFYQEAGRAGRDGRACLSLILPAFSDDSAAKALNSELVISIKRGQQRWLSMFHHPDRQQLGKSRFVLRLDVPPGPSENDIDMVGARSTTWSARTLTLMARSGLIRLIGIPPETDREALKPGCVYQGVELLDMDHGLESCWLNKVEPSRKKLWDANTANLDYMFSFLNMNTCPAELLKSLYTIEIDHQTYPVAARCGGCPIGENSSACLPLDEAIPIPPWPWHVRYDLHAVLSRLLDENGRLIVYYGEDHAGLKFVRKLKALFKALDGWGVHKLIVLGSGLPDAEEILSFGVDRPFFVSFPKFLSTAGLPPGPEIVFLSRQMKILPEHIQHREFGHERILLAPESVEPQWRPDTRFKDVDCGTGLPFDEFYRRIVQ